MAGNEITISWSAIKDATTLLIAAVGCVLGIYNTYVSKKDKRVNLKAIAKYAYPMSSSGDFGHRMACIEVTNLSAFAVYVEEIGFEIIGSTNRFAITDPFTHDHLPFARRLESRQSITGYSIEPEQHRDGVAGRCYVRTQAGEWFYGNMLGNS